METRIRPDGTHYIESNRTIYMAAGDAPLSSASAVRALCVEFAAKHQQGASPEEAGAIFGPQHRALATRAASLIRAFEGGADGQGGLEVIDVSIEHQGYLALQNLGGMTYPAELSDLGDQIARALGSLLLSLGCKNVMAMNVD